MIADSSRSPSSGPHRSGASRPLKRGKACSVCRGLKIKCDGAHPICGPCLRNPKPDPCEWDNGPGKSKVAMLTEEVSALRARIHELENPGTTTPSVTLHDPWWSYKESLPSESFSLGPSPHSPFSPDSTTSSLPSGRRRNHFASLEAMTPSTGTSVSPSRQLLSLAPASTTEVCPDLNWERPQYSSHALQEPPHSVIPFLLQTFLPHATEFGFFLDILTFHRSATAQHPFGHHLRPTPALLTAVYLWGAHLSKPRTPPQIDEQALLIRALHHVVTDTLGTHPRRILHTIQAEVLLSTYYFRTGRFLEAKARLGSALSLALSTQMHRQRSTQYQVPSPLGISNDAPTFSSPPQDPIEAGEHINGFWTVFALHKMVSFALDPFNGMCGALEAPGLQIDTPWPFDSVDYRNGYLTPDIQGNNTVKQFLAGVSTANRNDVSHPALVVKAAILCHRASFLTSQWKPNMAQRETESFTAFFHSIDNLLENFQTWIPKLPQSGANTASIRTLLLIHSLTNAAIIKLHNIFSYVNPTSNQKCLKAACDMFAHNGVDLRSLGALNPVYGALWQVACNVFIEEISRRQTSASAWPTSISEESLRHNLDLGMQAFNDFSENCTYIRYQQRRVEEGYTAIHPNITDYHSSSSSLTPS